MVSFWCSGIVRTLGGCSEWSTETGVAQEPEGEERRRRRNA